jgi:hypothetical protein
MRKFSCAAWLKPTFCFFKSDIFMVVGRQGGCKTLSEVESERDWLFVYY